jgi:hypothetical protein
MATCPYTAEQFEALIAAAIAAVRYHEGAPAIDALQAAVEACAGPVFAYRAEEEAAIGL